MLVLADKFSTEPVKEDLSNIMRVISMKNYSESTRCIVQLLYYSSKVRREEAFKQIQKFAGQYLTRGKIGLV